MILEFIFIFSRKIFCTEHFFSFFLGSSKKFLNGVSDIDLRRKIKLRQIHREKERVRESLTVEAGKDASHHG